MEVIKRWGRGTLSEIFGSALVPADMQNRLMNYTDGKYQAMLDHVSPGGTKLYEGVALSASGLKISRFLITTFLTCFRLIKITPIKKWGLNSELKWER